MTARVVAMVKPHCRICRSVLDDEEDDLQRQICESCAGRPEAKRLGPVAGAAPGPARAFTAAERALIGKLHGFMSAGALLELLNERLAADLGPDASPYTLDQLLEVTKGLPSSTAGGGDWTSLRRVLAQARRGGLLATITPQVVEDFSVVYQLAPAQLMHLKDVLAHAREDR